MKKVNYVMLVTSIITLMVACGKISYRKTKSGLVYKIFPTNGKDSLLKDGQIVKFNYTVKLNDSLLYSTYGKMPGYAKLTPAEPAPYNLLEILPLMRKGDSAITVEFMSSGPIIAAILEKKNAVNDFRKLIGATDPAKAEAGTIRKLYAASVGENAIHGSDSDENAKIEGDFMFSVLERF